MSKTLGHLLSTISHRKGYSIKVGSIDGNGFIYCHKVDSNTIDEIRTNYTKTKAREQKLMKKSKWQLENLDLFYEQKINHWLTLKKNQPPKAKKELKKWEHKRDMFVNKLMKLKESDKNRLPQYIAHLNWDIYHDYFERKVVDMVDGISPDEPNTKIIYVEGYERGNYWTIKEYTKSHLPQDKKDKYNVRLPKLD